jgi:hypothetical protein
MPAWPGRNTPARVHVGGGAGPSGGTSAAQPAVVPIDVARRRSPPLAPWSVGCAAAGIGRVELASVDAGVAGHVLPVAGTTTKRDAASAVVLPETRLTAVIFAAPPVSARNGAHCSRRPRPLSTMLQ